MHVKIWDDPVTFTVRGKGRFPMDMLRHSMAWPTSSADADAINERGLRSVSVTAQLTRYVKPERWESFGWAVADADMFPYVQQGLVDPANWDRIPA